MLSADFKLIHMLHERVLLGNKLNRTIYNNNIVIINRMNDRCTWQYSQKKDTTTHVVTVHGTILPPN